MRPFSGARKPLLKEAGSPQENGLVVRKTRGLEHAMLHHNRPRSSWSAGKQYMHNGNNFLLFSLLGWMALVSLLVVAYLTSLEIQERRRNRRMNKERQRLGLRPV